MATIGCIGLGVFGARVAARLGREGFGLLVHDAWIEPVRYFLLKNTADMADNPRMMGSLCDVVVTVLPDAAATRAAALGRLGVVDGLKDGRQCVLLDLGTTSAAEARALAEEMLPRGIHYVEAPARGSPADAREGRLKIPVGGDPEMVERAMPVLRALGREVRHTGLAGSAHMMSALVEHVRASMVLAMAEAVAIGGAAGVSPAALRDWCSADGLLAPALAELVRDRPAGSGHTIATLVDNLRSLSAFAREQGLSPRHGELVSEMWRAASQALGPQRDIAEVGRFLETDMRAPSTPEAAA